jgi:hypothetical protein
MFPMNGKPASGNFVTLATQIKRSTIPREFARIVTPFDLPRRRYEGNCAGFRPRVGRAGLSIDGTEGEEEV